MLKRISGPASRESEGNKPSLIGAVLAAREKDFYDISNDLEIDL